MTSAEAYIAETLSPVQRAILIHLHQIIVSLPGVSCKMRYKIPFYDRISWVCYLNKIKQDGVELAFIRGKDLYDDTGLLQLRKRKQIAGVHYYHPSEIDEEWLNALLHQALLLDEKAPKAAK